MGWRRCINLLALVGVLAHAAFVVRHHGVMLDAHMERQGLLSALGVICHGNGETTAPAGGEVPWVPLPTDQQNGQCPLCAGLASVHALAGVVVASVPVEFQAAAPLLVRHVARPVEVARIRPLSRGPPQSA